MFKINLIKNNYLNLSVTSKKSIYNHGQVKISGEVQHIEEAKIPSEI